MEISGIGGAAFSVAHSVELHIALHPEVHAKVECFVLPSAEGDTEPQLDFLLGRPALRKFCVHIDFCSEGCVATAMTSSNRGRRVELQPSSRWNKDSKHQNPVQSLISSN